MGTIGDLLQGKTEVTCDIQILSSGVSRAIGTVGIVSFATDLANANGGVIEFGPSSEYGLWAPVDIKASRTLLLGMTANREHHYRVVLTAGTTYCVGADQTLLTGPLPTGGPSNAPVEVPSEGSASERAPGFLINATFNGNWIYILNQDGQVVWFYRAPMSQLSRALLSFDGQHMYARELNVARTDTGRLLKIAVDGSSEQVINLPTSHHDFTVTPEGVVYIRKAPDSLCDALYRHSDEAVDDSTDTLIFRVADAFPTTARPEAGSSGEECHTNSVHYVAADGGFTASDLWHNAYFKLSALGQLEWVLGRDDSTFSGPGTDWERQHGHQLLAGNRLLFFNNGGATEGSSRAREVSFSLSARTALFSEFSYESAEASTVLGDVQRLPGGNTLVTYSVNAGSVHEVGADGRLIQSLRLPGGAAGYSCHRPTLYGPPPE